MTDNLQFGLFLFFEDALHLFGFVEGPGAVSVHAQDAFVERQHRVSMTYADEGDAHLSNEVVNASFIVDIERAGRFVHDDEMRLVQ